MTQVGAHADAKAAGPRRSRNDQVATDYRLWLHKELLSTRKALRQLIEVACGRAEAEAAVLMPGFTHLQPAQTIRWGHWLMCHCTAWQRDDQRMRDMLPRVAMLPLGSGALAGNPFKVDRDFLAQVRAARARTGVMHAACLPPPDCAASMLHIAPLPVQELGMTGVMPNSMDAVADRDFVLEAIFAMALHMNHLSRFAEDLIIYSSNQFGYVQCSDAYATGSSLMPQKKNPDALELIRGKGGRMLVRALLPARFQCGSCRSVLAEPALHAVLHERCCGQGRALEWGSATQVGGGTCRAISQAPWRCSRARRRRTTRTTRRSGSCCSARWTR